MDQLSVDDAAPAQPGQHWPLARHFSPPNPQRARAVYVCGQWGPFNVRCGADVLLQPVRLQKAAGVACRDAKWARPLPFAVRTGGGRAI